MHGMRKETEAPLITESNNDFMGSGLKVTPVDSPVKQSQPAKKAQMVDKKILDKSNKAIDKNSKKYKSVDPNLDDFYSDEEDPNEHSFLNKDQEKKRLKIEKFDVSSRPKAYTNIIRVSFVALVFIAISLADFLVNRNSQKDLQWMLDNQKSLIDLQSSVNYAYASVYEGIALKKHDYEMGDVKLLEYHLSQLATHKRELVDYLERSYPVQMSSYEDSLKSFMFRDMCENYFA